MIFVTTGTAYSFNPLIEKIDKIAPSIKEKIIIQVGHSTYNPLNCEFFSFSPDITNYIKKARLVIAHGGAGTSFEVLTLGKKLISIENKEVNDSHQWDLLKKLSDENYCLWCKDIDQIEKYIKIANKHVFKKYVPPICTIAEEINTFLGVKK